MLFEIRVKLHPTIDLGAGPEGHRTVVTGVGGRFEGPWLRGQVLAISGGDYARIRSDGSGAIDVRLCLQTDDGAIILMTYLGRMLARTPEAFAYAHDFAKPDDREGAAMRHYVRTNTLFETDDILLACIARPGCGSIKMPECLRKTPEKLFFFEKRTKKLLRLGMRGLAGTYAN